jgi:hypothetical protein
LAVRSVSYTGRVAARMRYTPVFRALWLLWIGIRVGIGIGCGRLLRRIGIAVAGLAGTALARLSKAKAVLPRRTALAGLLSEAKTTLAGCVLALSLRACGRADWRATGADRGDILGGIPDKFEEFVVRGLLIDHVRGMIDLAAHADDISTDNGRRIAIERSLLSIGA